MAIVRVTLELKYSEHNGGAYQVFSKEGKVVGRVSKKVIDLYQAGMLEDDISQMECWNDGLKKAKRRFEKERKRRSNSDPWRKRLISMCKSVRMRMTRSKDTCGLTCFKSQSWRSALHRMKYKCSVEFMEKQSDEWSRWADSVRSNCRKRKERRDHIDGIENVADRTEL